MKRIEPTSHVYYWNGLNQQSFSVEGFVENELLSQKQPEKSPFGVFVNIDCTSIVSWLVLVLQRWWMSQTNATRGNIARTISKEPVDKGIKVWGQSKYV